MYCTDGAAGAEIRMSEQHAGATACEGIMQPSHPFQSTVQVGRQEKGTLPPASSKGLIHYRKGFKTEVKKLRRQPGQKRHLFPTRLAFLHSDCSGGPCSTNLI